VTSNSVTGSAESKVVVGEKGNYVCCGVLAAYKVLFCSEVFGQLTIFSFEWQITPTGLPTSISYFLFAPLELLITSSPSFATLITFSAKKGLH
jgi:hypothetical protein